MTPFLSIQNTYQTIDLALFKGTTLVESISENKKHSSKNLVPLLNNLLKNNNLSLSDCAFIGVNQGPGPFTTLGTIIASANGISFGTQIPLVGVDGLDAFVAEQNNDEYPYTVIMLNAFNKEVYFAVQSPSTPVAKGYKKADLFLQELKTKFSDKTMRFLGNGVELYQEEILDIFGQYAVIPNPLPHAVSVQQIGLMALEQWNKKIGITQQLFPLYLKEQQFAKTP